MEWSFNIDSLAELLSYNPQAPLLFTSKLFLFLFLPFFAVYLLLRKKLSLRIIYVSLFSLYFYYKTGGWYFLLLIFMSLSDFSIGYTLAHSTKELNRKLLVALSLVIDLGILCYFKYTNFFIETFDNLFNRPFKAEAIFLPVGISFFTFQSISYIIDLYRRQVKPVRLYIDYLFYLSFFPQLVAGPIVRARDFMPQITRNPVQITREMLGGGIYLIILGLIKKAVISDYISINFVDRIFDDPMLYGGLENLMGVYGYALQIYCDFSGYSDMAIGIALLLGFRFPKNFDTPYKSATITEFWRRWHISLSNWLRDYLYIPLGGNRKGKLRTYLNLIITMLLGGLWHGAAWRFVLWGAWHGAGLAIHKLLLSLFPKLKATGRTMKRGWRVAGIVLTFNFVCVGWVFFRAGSLQQGFAVLNRIFTSFDLSNAADFVSGYWRVLALMAAGFVLHILPERISDGARKGLTALPTVVQAVVMAVVIWGVMQIRSGEIQPFIYFQF